MKYKLIKEKIDVYEETSSNSPIIFQLTIGDSFIVIESDSAKAKGFLGVRIDNDKRMGYISINTPKAVHLIPCAKCGLEKNSEQISEYLFYYGNGKFNSKHSYRTVTNTIKYNLNKEPVRVQICDVCVKKEQLSIGTKGLLISLSLIAIILLLIIYFYNNFKNEVFIVSLLVGAYFLWYVFKYLFSAIDKLFAISGTDSIGDEIAINMYKSVLKKRGFDSFITRKYYETLD